MVNSRMLVIGSKNYSSWSLRPWLLLKKCAVEFTERLIPFDAPDYRALIAAISPSRRVPVLIEGELKIWDSLAICETVAERCGRGLPADAGARAVARAVSAEMHAGFPALRSECPMNVRARARRVADTAELRADIARIDSIWTQCRATYGAGGMWLFGDFSIADAMFAPVAFRFRTYGAQLSETANAYLAAVLADSHMREWSAASEAEQHRLPDVERVGT